MFDFWVLGMRGRAVFQGVRRQDIGVHFDLRNRFANKPAVPIFNGFAIQFKVIVVSLRSGSARRPVVDTENGV
jgi:hypothetical protein